MRKYLTLLVSWLVSYTACHIDEIIATGQRVLLSMTMCDLPVNFELRLLLVIFSIQDAKMTIGEAENRCHCIYYPPLPSQVQKNLTKCIFLLEAGV